MLTTKAKILFVKWKRWSRAVSGFLLISAKTGFTQDCRRLDSRVHAYKIQNVSSFGIWYLQDLLEGIVSGCVDSVLRCFSVGWEPGYNSDNCRSKSFILSSHEGEMDRRKKSKELQLNKRNIKVPLSSEPLEKSILCTVWRRYRHNWVLLSGVRWKKRQNSRKPGLKMHTVKHFLPHQVQFIRCLQIYCLHQYKHYQHIKPTKKG